MYGVSKKIFGLLCMAVVGFVLVLFSTNGNVTYEKNEEETIKHMGEWETIEEKKQAVSVSTRNKTDSMSERKMAKSLPLNLKDGSAISFFTKNQYAEVRIDNELIYYFFEKSKEKVKIPGNRWNFVALSGKDAGKTISITLWGKDGENREPEVLIGDKTELVMNRISKNGSAFIGSLLIGTMGIIILFAWFIKRKKVEKKAFYIGIITIEIAAWSIIQTQIIQIFLGYYYELNMTQYFLLLLIQYPLIRYVSENYGTMGKKVFEGLLEVYLGSILLVALGVGFNAINIREMEIVSYIYLWMCGAFILVLMGTELERTKGKKRKKVKAHMLFFICVLAVNLIDFFSYECYGVTDGARFTRWIVFLTLMILAYEVLEESMRLAKLGKDSEKMKSIAYNDALTCMGNRMAFMEKIKQIEKQNYKNYGVAMFDLNNLKVFNDVHGHSAGDYYLIISSEILQDIFGPYGNIYRIGGDEFCAILKGISEEEFELYAKEMYIRLSKLKGPYTTEEMSIAFGYKKYDEKYDRNLSSTTDRADACMYINKTKIKQRLKESILVG